MARTVVILLVLVLICTGCWDMKEINSLAIVSLAGVDKDPKTKEMIAYYQVINPTGVSPRTGSSAKAAVYTFKYSDYSLGRFSIKTGMSMPRQFFTAHMQSYIISERYAREGILELINYFELNPERRSNVNLYISDSPIHLVMNSFTPLDRVPGRFIRSLTAQYKHNFKVSVFPNRFKDLEKDLYRHTPTVIPIVHYKGDKPSSNSNKVENIDATKNDMSFADGAVFIRAHMVGRIDEKAKVIYYILNKKYERLTDTIIVNGEYVDIEARKIQVKRKWIKPGADLLLEIHTDLRILNNQQKTKTTMQNVEEIEKAFSELLTRRIQALEQLSEEKSWDLLGIQDNGGSEMNWKKTKLTIQVISTLKTIGNTQSPYILE